MRGLGGVLLGCMTLASVGFGVEESRTTYGFHGGINVHNTNINPAGAKNNVTGFTAGLVLEAPIVKRLLSIQSEVNFAQRGAPALGGLARTTLQYIEVPMLAKVELRLGAVRPYILGGPKFGYLLTAKTETAGISVSRSDFSTTNLGLEAGGGVGFGMGEVSEMFVMARYSFGLNDIDASAGSYKPEGIQLTAGVLF